MIVEFSNVPPWVSLTPVPYFVKTFVFRATVEFLIVSPALAETP